MTDDSRPDLPDWLTGTTTLADRLGLELLEVGPDRAVGRMPVAGNTQPMGLWHGGASGVLAETLASIAATLYALPEQVAVGVDLNATHHRAVREGWVTGVATPLHRGGRVASYQVVLTDDRDRLVCTARLTCQLVPAPPS